MPVTNTLTGDASDPGKDASRLLVEADYLIVRRGCS